MRGEAGHAGTVAMELRRDALPAAAELVLAVEQMGRTTPDLVATVGALTVEPGASNVIPSVARCSLDVRHPDDAIRGRAVQALAKRVREIGADRGLSVDWQTLQEHGAVHSDPVLIGRLEQAVADTGLFPMLLHSGAGHDGVVMAAVAPVAMLFVRCAGGISHHPAESVAVDDVAVAIEVLDRFLDRLAEEQP
jgi:allantoate deiminase